MKYIIFFALLLSISSANALDVAGFEKLSSDAEGSGVEAKMKNTALASYFAGVSDMLNASIGGESNKVLLGTGQNICLPFGVEFSGDVIRAMTYTEVKKARASGVFGKNMDTLFVSVFIYTALERNYPCKQV